VIAFERLEDTLEELFSAPPSQSYPVRVIVPPDNSILDIQSALRSCMQDDALLRDAIELFQEVLHKDMSVLVSAFAAGNRGEILSVSHGIKGAAATLGANEIRDRAKIVEFAARDDSTQISQDLITDLEQAVLRFCKHVRKSGS